MEITLGSESAARIRAVLGDDIDLSPAAVPRALARLAEESPALYSEILDTLSGSDVRLDSERTLHRRHRRNALRRVLFGWGEYESEAGDRLVAKRRVAAAVPLALAVVMLATAGISSLLHRPTRLPAGSAPFPVTQPAGLSLRTGRSTIGPRSAREGPWWPPASGHTVLAAAAKFPVAARATPQLPLVPPLALQGPGGFAFAGAPLPPSIVFNRAPADAEPGGSAVRRSPVVYARDATGDTAPSPEPRSAPAAPRALLGPRTLKVGDRIAARLVTAVIVAADVPPVPVVAQGGDGSTWLGYAGLQSDRRVHISFRAVDHAGASSEVGLPLAGINGVALDPESMSPGLPGRAVIRPGATVVASITAVAQAASEYVQAVARAAQFTVSDGGTQITVGGPAPGWTYAASHFADMLNSQTARIAIETFEVGPGAPCLILITGAP